jgi:hypothetical protein
MMKPAAAIPIITEMCQVRSLSFPDEMPTAMPTKPATREGGAVRTSVMVVLKPRDDTTVGKNYTITLEPRSEEVYQAEPTWLKDVALRCMFCMNTKR